MAKRPARRLLEITGADGQILQPDWLKGAEAAHRQLRPQLPKNYAAKMQRVFAGGGRMKVCVEGEQVLGLAVYRCHENTHQGLHLYVDDLVTDEQQRSTGVGRLLLRALEREARKRACTALTLDSGTQRKRAHRFYLREGMDISSFHFDKLLG